MRNKKKENGNTVIEYFQPLKNQEAGSLINPLYAIN